MLGYNEYLEILGIVQVCPENYIEKYMYNSL